MPYFKDSIKKEKKGKMFLAEQIELWQQNFAFKKEMEREYKLKVLAMV